LKENKALRLFSIYLTTIVNNVQYLELPDVLDDKNNLNFKDIDQSRSINFEAFRNFLKKRTILGLICSIAIVVAQKYRALGNFPDAKPS